MDWSDEGVFLCGKPLGEANLIAEVLTLEHGRHLGLVRGGGSRRIRPTLQPGNLVRVTWRARLAEHLGGYTVELMEAHGPRALDDPRALAAIGTIAELVKLLPERDPHPELFATTLHVLRSFAEPGIWPALMVYWEFQLLQELGFGLELTSCAATGATKDLVYVSPKSARAVSREAGAPNADKMLSLPQFLIDSSAPLAPSDIASGFALTGYFLERDVLAPNGLKFPDSRGRLLDLLQREPHAA